MEWLTWEMTDAIGSFFVLALFQAAATCSNALGFMLGVALGKLFNLVGWPVIDMVVDIWKMTHNK